MNSKTKLRSDTYANLIEGSVQNLNQLIHTYRDVLLRGSKLPLTSGLTDDERGNLSDAVDFTEESLQALEEVAAKAIFIAALFRQKA